MPFTSSPGDINSRPSDPRPILHARALQFPTLVKGGNCVLNSFQILSLYRFIGQLIVNQITDTSALFIIHLLLIGPMQFLRT